MSDIAFVNLELVQENFIESVNQEKSALRRIVRAMSPEDRPSLRFHNVTDSHAIYNAVVSGTRIVHIAAHGSRRGSLQSTDDTGVEVLHALSDMADYLEENYLYLDVDVIVLDACFSAERAWRKQLTRMVGPGKTILLIGSVRKLPFYQAEQFFRSFYSALLTRKLPKGRAALRNRAKTAFAEAQEEFKDNNVWFSRLRNFELHG